MMMQFSLRCHWQHWQIVTQICGSDPSGLRLCQLLYAATLLSLSQWWCQWPSWTTEVDEQQTVCKTFCPMVSDRCLSCLCVTLVYCGQMVGRIKMKLGTEVGLSPSILCEMGIQLSLKRGTASPTFRSMSVVAKRSPILTTAEHLF